MVQFLVMNRRHALEAMLLGKTVRAMRPLYLNHEDPPEFRWNDELQHIEWCEHPNSLDGQKWHWSQRSFYLSDEFEVTGV